MGIHPPRHSVEVGAMDNGFRPPAPGNSLPARVAGKLVLPAPQRFRRSWKRLL